MESHISSISSSHMCAMSQTITEKILAGETPESVGLLHLRGTSTVPQTSAFPDLETKGYTVLKGVIPKHRADQYVDEMYKWAEGMGLGFDRSERSTWRVQNMPNFHKWVLHGAALIAGGA